MRSPCSLHRTTQPLSCRVVESCWPPLQGSGNQRDILAAGRPGPGRSRPGRIALPDNPATVTQAQRRHIAIPLLEAAGESPNWAGLVERMQASSRRLEAIRSLLPRPLLSSVQAGPIEDGHWCLLVSSNAVAAKMRQLLPALQAHLASRGLPVTGIRIKVQARKG